MKLGIAVLAVMLVVLAQYLLLPATYRESASSPSAWFVMFSIAGGFVVGLLIAKVMIEKLVAGKPFDFLSLASTAPRGSRIGAYLAALLALPLALTLGFIVGGNFGGGLGGQIGDSGTVLGIGLGICLITGVTAVAAGIVGFVVGGLAEKLITGKRANS